MPVDNLRHAETLAIVPDLIARGVRCEAITQKVIRKRTITT